MTHTQDVLLLLAACRENPDEDTLRLELADALQESGDEARAKLIRVQVELSHTKYEGCCDRVGNGLERCDVAGYRVVRCGCRRSDLLHREAQLLRDNPHWLAKPCSECNGEGTIPDPESRMLFGRNIVFDCPTCGGTEDLFTQRQWNPDYQEYQPGTDCIACLDRGLVRVSAPPERLWVEGRPRRKGPTYPMPWLEAIASDPFVVGVDVEGLGPSRHLETWRWDFGVSTDSRRLVGTLPVEIWKLCNGTYPTQSAAKHVLSVALLKWGSHPNWR